VLVGMPQIDKGAFDRPAGARHDLTVDLDLSARCIRLNEIGALR
jgi:hypothetical protein